MDSSPQITKNSHHARSFSSSCSPHPIAQQFEQQLCRVRSSLSASTSSSIRHQISSLQNAYNCFEELLLLPLKQQNIVNNYSTKRADSMLDRSVRLLDVCSATRDALSQTRECVQGIQSVLRRRCGDELMITKEVAGYIKSRKVIKKSIHKSLKGLKTILSESISELEKSQGATDVIIAVKEMEEVTVNIFESLLSYIAGTKAQSRTSKWLSISKFRNQQIACETQKMGIEEVDAAINSLLSQNGKLQIEGLRSQMLQCEASIQDLEEGLECLFRSLVKNRAILLNLLNL